MEYETKKIIHMEMGHKREAGGSNKLEGYLFEKGMDHILQSGLRITEVVTDASRTLISILGKIIL